MWGLQCSGLWQMGGFALIRADIDGLGEAVKGPDGGLRAGSRAAGPGRYSTGSLEMGFEQEGRKCRRHADSEACVTRPDSTNPAIAAMASPVQTAQLVHTVRDVADAR